MWIKDLYFFHEHPRKINWVEFAIILSPYTGPFLSAFIVYKTKWQWAFWLATIYTGIGLILVFFLDETLYERNISDQQRVRRGPRWRRLLGIEQTRVALRYRSLTQAVMRPVIAITYVPVLLCCIYYFLNFAWVVAINTTISIWLTEFYGFNSKDIGK